MQLGLVGLGKMGGNMRERLRRAGHEVVGYDRNKAVSDASSLADLVRRLDAPRVVRELMESAYLLVYLVIPAAAVTLMAGDHVEALPRFWATVLLAEFISYGMLPWLQTRSPRALETAPATHSQLAVRRLNAAILSRGSIQVNTVPSGHAAGAALCRVRPGVSPGPGSA